MAAAPAMAALSRVPDLFAAGAWESARAEAVGDDDGARPGESQLWRSRLAASPSEAIAILHEGLGQRRLPGPVRARLALELSELELGRGRPGDALAALSPLLDDREEAPGAVRVNAARALVALGRGPRAREILIGVLPGDPAYGLARLMLGDIALAQGDAGGALGWYDQAEQADPALRRRLASGRCRALLRTGRAREASALATQLEALDPGGLALLEVRRAGMEAGLSAVVPRRAGAQADEPTVNDAAGGRDAVAVVEEPEAPAATALRAAPVARAAQPPRYTLQFGAFADPARAIEFRERRGGAIPGLVLEEGVDARGQPVWRARAGGWKDRAAAEAAARALGDRLGLDVIVVDREAAARTGA